MEFFVILFMSELVECDAIGDRPKIEQSGGEMIWYTRTKLSLQFTTGRGGDRA
jgi:hypothetical protein